MVPFLIISVIAIVFLIIVGYVAVYIFGILRGLENMQRPTYETLLKSLEKTTHDLNKLSTKLNGPPLHDSLMEYFEATLKLQEQLLVVMRQLATENLSNATVDSAYFLSKSLQARVAKLSLVFSDQSFLEELDLSKLFGEGDKDTYGSHGCYFCSCLLNQRQSYRLNIKSLESQKSVMSCSVCYTSIRRTGVAKVLFFVQDGSQVHWSKFKDFSPDFKYWNINSIVERVEKPKLAIASPLKNADQREKNTSDPGDLDPK